MLQSLTITMKHYLIDELQHLATDGFEVIINEIPTLFRAGLATVSADNLSAHAIAGFQKILLRVVFVDIAWPIMMILMIK